jgi:hypothetical protein
MKTTRRSGRANILRRIEELEARSIDGSGLAPHSPAWLAFWQRQVQLQCIGKEHVTLTVEGVRAVMQATPDDCEDDPVCCFPERAGLDARI